MIPILTVLGLIATHMVGDFCLQSNFMGLNKSKRMDALILHTTIYSLCFLLPFGLRFVLLTFLTHTLTDFITSRIGAKLWYIDLYKRPDEDIDPCGDGLISNYGAYEYFAHLDMKKRWPFWWMLGFDQTIHLVTLTLTWYLIYGT